MKLIDLSDKKTLRKSRVIHTDILKILNELVRLQIKLREYKHYLPVQNVLSMVEDEKQILEIHLNKHKRIIEDNENQD